MAVQSGEDKDKGRPHYSLKDPEEKTKREETDGRMGEHCQESFRLDVWKNFRWSDTSKQSNLFPMSVSVQEVLSLSVTCFNF